VTARTPDGLRTGWAGDASRDIATLHPGIVGATAAALATRGSAVVALEPGRRTVILMPAAVAQLLRFTADSFSATNTDSGKTPFSLPANQWITNGRRNRIGQRVMDKRLRLISDPVDPLGGFLPFYEPGTASYAAAGLPFPAVTWIERGVLRDLAYDLRSGLGRPWNELPYSVRMEAMPGETIATVEEMIAACEDAVLITRFGSIEMVNPTAGVISGVTRDGCFHVKHGAIARPVKNFRFLESPVQAFNRIRMIGQAVRAALSLEAPTDTERSGVMYPSRWDRWPKSPVIVPPLMIEDFRLTALADAI
jgi:predicted Zn-dependent protease